MIRGGGGLHTRHLPTCVGGLPGACPAHYLRITGGGDIVAPNQIRGSKFRWACRVFTSGG